MTEESHQRCGGEEWRAFRPTKENVVIELMEGLPSGVVGLEAVGTVTAADYELVAAPAIERALEGHRKIRLIHVLGDRLEGHEAQAIWDDAKLGLSHLRSFERIAVVTDLTPVRTLVTSVGWSVPGELRLFSNAERTEAESWASEGLDEES